MEIEANNYEKIMALIAETWELQRQNQLDIQALAENIELDRRRLEAERLQREKEREQERLQREQERQQREQEREQERQQREQEREQERQQREQERQQREQEREQERQQERLLREQERQQREQEREQERQQREQERQQREQERKEWEKKWDKALAATNKKVAEVTDVLGLFAEEQVAPAVLRLFSQFDWNLRMVMQRVKVTNERGDVVAEVDLLLVNDTVSVAVEVKNRLRKDDIDEHLERIAKMQKYPSKAFAETRLYGAVAAMIADPSLINYALKKGLAVIVPSGEAVEMRVPDDYPSRYTTVGPKI